MLRPLFLILTNQRKIRKGNYPFRTFYIHRIFSLYYARRCHMKGSITIEASFIYSIIIVFIFLTILYNFFCHDKVSAKANAYTSLIKSYFNEESTYDKSDYANSINNFCLLKDSYTCSYNKYTKKLCLMDNYGNFFNVAFSSYERCDFIRQYYCLIKKTLSQKN